MIECNHNCLECPYPDVPEECLEAALTWDEHKELDVIDKDIINPKTAKQKAVAAQQKAWYEANKDKVAARQKAWYEANKDKVAARQKSIALARKAQGMTQSGLAAIVGVTQATVSMWETGALKANWDKLCAVLPELEAYRPERSRRQTSKSSSG
nr:MAG TPA: helix-turn-helix XRE-family like protein [Caudoviricetes sp.]